MKIDKCPKCCSDNVIIYTNICETTKNGFGIRVQCKDCNFVPPKSKWQWMSTDKAIIIWNTYKRS